MRLLCDEMLGRLARWLRLLGLDAAYVRDLPDEAVLRAAGDEGRVLLTRDAALAARAPPGRALLVASRDPREQLREVLAGLGLRPDPAMYLTRCSLCNEPLSACTPGEAAASGRVPPAVLSSRVGFRRCARCGRLYWEGTHAARIAEALRGLEPGRVP